jgi:beta-glucosidase/6-phospho-beta-glucosidase/beta-galactosidase
MKQPASTWLTDGRLHFALGIEDTFVPQSREGQRALDEYDLTEHYQCYQADFHLAAQAGAELLRWGVPWYRVNPAPGRWDWSWTDKAIEAQLAAGLRPIVDLIHYGTPKWLENQFANPDYPKHVEEYARQFSRRYGDAVTDYTPVNEPVIHALFCGEYAYWPPYLTGPDGFAAIAANIARGFVRSQLAIAEELGDAAVFVHVEAAMSFIEDAPSKHAVEIARLRHQVHLVEDLVTGRVDSAHPLRRQLATVIDDRELRWFDHHAVQPDVMGVNYYPRHSTELFEAGVTHSGGFADPRPTIDRGVDGLRDALEDFAGRYEVPVMVTETCVTGSVQERLQWLDQSVNLVENLRAAGTNVIGYTWWPLFDMYEWTWRHSTNPRANHRLTMGLYDLEETSTGLARIPNPVADRYRTHALRARAQTSHAHAALH